MEKVIVENSRSKVIYNDVEKAYTKYFYSGYSKKIKFFLKLRRYPGKNYKYISDIFEKEGIKVAEIIDFDKYMVKTKEIPGTSLLECISTNTKEKEILIEKYIKLVSKIINLGIYFGDFHFGNFIVYNEEIYVIDLEDYKKDILSKYRKKSLLKRLKRYLFRLADIYNQDICDGEKIYYKILQKLK